METYCCFKDIFLKSLFLFLIVFTGNAEALLTVVPVTATTQVALVVTKTTTLTFSGQAKGTLLRASPVNAAVASVTLSGTKATITAVAVGQTSLTVTDGVTTLTIPVNVYAAVTLSPAALTVPIGLTGSITIVGGSGTYTLASSAANVQLQASSPFLGNVFSVKGMVIGPSKITVTDSKTGSVSSLTVTVKNLLSTTTAQLNMIAGKTAAVSLTNANGTVLVTSANVAIATKTNTNTSITVTAVAVGQTSLTVTDGVTTLTIPVNVYAAVMLSPAALTVPIGWNSGLNISGGSGRYNIANSVATVLSATSSGLSISLHGLALGTAKITVSDAVTGGVFSVNVQVIATPTDTGYRILGWNDLGMHCMDADYSIFAILPPYNNLHAQVVNNGKLLTTNDISLSYKSFADATGSINTTSNRKTNFWAYVSSLFSGISLAENIGLTGNPTPSENPAPMAFNASPISPIYTNKNNWFEATGIPITPYDDLANKNTYPMVDVVASDHYGNKLASAKIVLPVSDEMSCTSCHASTSGVAAKPIIGWVNDGSSTERDYRLNILRLHDEKSFASASSAHYRNALSVLGYDALGLELTATGGKSILCASCHQSNALGTTGLPGATPLTTAMHTKHALVIDPTNLQTLDSSSNRNACYQCHPGSTTKCLRGAMGNAIDPVTGLNKMQCQNCHGKMSNVGSSTRVGWLDQPNCQSCHHDGKRELSAVDSNNNPIRYNHPSLTDTTFASNTDVPAVGYSLFRFSLGHGGLQCESCHGATHAEYASSHDNDNVLSIATQGYAGTIRECTSCHANLPINQTTMNFGPHRMHPVGQQWVTLHHDISKGHQAECSYCHGANYQGSPLSVVKITKTFNKGNGTVTFDPGHQVGCYDCHNGPNGG